MKNNGGLQKSNFAYLLCCQVNGYLKSSLQVGSGSGLLARWNALLSVCTCARLLVGLRVESDGEDCTHFINLCS